MKLVAVDGRAWSNDLLQDALRASKDSKQPIDLLVENANSSRFIPFRITTASETRIWSAPKHPAPREMFWEKS